VKRIVEQGGGTRQVLSGLISISFGHVVDFLHWNHLADLPLSPARRKAGGAIFESYVKAHKKGSKNSSLLPSSWVERQFLTKLFLD
jgi:hypothetical protein